MKDFDTMRRGSNSILRRIPARNVEEIHASTFYLHRLDFSISLYDNDSEVFVFNGNSFF